MLIQDQPDIIGDISRWIRKYHLLSDETPLDSTDKVFGGYDTMVTKPLRFDEWDTIKSELLAQLSIDAPHLRTKE